MARKGVHWLGCAPLLWRPRVTFLPSQLVAVWVAERHNYAYLFHYREISSHTNEIFVPEALLSMDRAVVGILTRLQLLKARTHRRSGDGILSGKVSGRPVPLRGGNHTGFTMTSSGLNMPSPPSCLRALKGLYVVVP